MVTNEGNVTFAAATEAVIPHVCVDANLSSCQSSSGLTVLSFVSCWSSDVRKSLFTARSRSVPHTYHGKRRERERREILKDSSISSLDRKKR